MKKASNVILAVFLLFICVIFGFFIGRVSARNQITTHTISSSDQSVSATDQSIGETSVADGKININLASSRQLQMLPNIGEVLAARIIEYRTQYGPFSSIDDLILVEGIGEKRLEEIRQYISVGG